MCAGLPVRFEREGLAAGPEAALRAAGAAKGLVASAEDQAVAGNRRPKMARFLVPHYGASER